jgi:hypothetical protein
MQIALGEATGAMQKFFIHSIMLKKDKCPLKGATNLGTSASRYSELVAEMLDLVRNDRRF